MKTNFLFLLILLSLMINLNIVFAHEEKYPLGMNLAGIYDSSTQFPFLDLTRQARKWISQMEGKPWGKGGDLVLDNHGWVRSLRPNQSVDWIFISKNGPLPDTEFVVWYEGDGKIDYSGLVRKVDTLGKNRDLIRVVSKGKYAILTIKKTNPDNYIRNIKIVAKKYLHLYEKGKIFNPQWLDYIRRFTAIRLMDWLKTNNSKISKWSDRPKLEDYTWSLKGVPIEVIVDLANEIGSDVWLNIPHRADDDYVRRLARYVSDNLIDSHKIYLEHSNEVWNWRFQQTHYADKAAKRLWGKHGNGYIQWHAKRTVEICSLWRTERPKIKKRLQCVLGIQGGWYNLALIALECPLWEKAPCYNGGIDALAIAGYFTGCVNGSGGIDRIQRIRKWFSEKDEGMEKAYEQTLEGRYFDCKRTIISMKSKYKKFKDLANKYGMSLLAYEGGQHITGNGLKIQNDKDFIRFHMKFNRTDYMRKLTFTNFENWKMVGGGLFMYFDDISPPSKWGSWGSMDYLGDYTSPKYKAIIEFGTQNQQWW
ncbi:MAG TPA: cellulose-binding protein [Gammaproteobacteria bacterium]|nr:cellulose-binding protein [Gammaproteobacteria bacterium]